MASEDLAIQPCYRITNESIAREEEHVYRRCYYFLYDR